MVRSLGIIFLLSPSAYAQLAAEIIVGGVAYSLTLLLLHRTYLRGIWQFARRYQKAA